MKKRLLFSLILVTAVVLLATYTVHATTVHNPPWADNFHYFYAADNFSRDAATIAEGNQDSIGYSADARLNYSASNAAYYLQNDAVWSIYAHAYRTLMQTYDGSNYSDLTRDMILGYNLSGLKVAVFYGCHSAEGPNSDHITNAAVTAGVGASLGFYDFVYISEGYTTGPAYTWSKYFW